MMKSKDNHLHLQIRASPGDLSEKNALISSRHRDDSWKEKNEGEILHRG